MPTIYACYIFIDQTEIQGMPIETPKMIYQSWLNVSGWPLDVGLHCHGYVNLQQRFSLYINYWRSASKLQRSKMIRPMLSRKTFATISLKLNFLVSQPNCLFQHWTTTLVGNSNDPPRKYCTLDVIKRLINQSRLVKTGQNWSKLVETGWNWSKLIKIVKTGPNL